MTIQRSRAAMFLAIGATAFAMALAPHASAETACADLGDGATLCQTPGSTSMRVSPMTTADTQTVPWALLFHHGGHRR